MTKCFQPRPPLSRDQRECLNTTSIVSMRHARCPKSFLPSKVLSLYRQIFVVVFIMTLRTILRHPANHPKTYSIFWPKIYSSKQITTSLLLPFYTNFTVRTICSWTLFYRQLTLFPNQSFFNHLLLGFCLKFVDKLPINRPKVHPKKRPTK